MPNHVSNLLTFSNNIEALMERTFLTKDVDVLSFKVGFLLVMNEESITSKLQPILESSSTNWLAADFKVNELCQKHIKLDDVEMVFETIDKESFIEFIAPFKDLSTREIYDILISLTPDKELKFPESQLWFPRPLKYDVQGFNSTFDEMAEDLSIPLLGCSSQYDDNIKSMGTKWGVYDHYISDNEMAFNTAWSPLNDEAMTKFIKFVKKETGAEFVEFICAEQASGFYMEGFYDKDESIFYFGEDEDLPFTYIESDEEEEIKDAKARGEVEIIKDLYCNEDEVSDSLIYFAGNYGLGG